LFQTPRNRFRRSGVVTNVAPSCSFLPAYGRSFLLSGVCVVTAEVALVVLQPRSVEICRSQCFQGLDACCCHKGCWYLDVFVLEIRSLSISYRRKISFSIFFCYSGFEFVRGFAR
ncbi:hypothetical protein L195_g037420, partial [Trifolium pratense]